MAICEQFQFEQLDQRSRDYLRRIRQGGQSVPGVFCPLSELPRGRGFVLGIMILLGPVVLSWSLFGKPPLALAMLQTAGLLLGGWLIFNAVRSNRARDGRNDAGHFVFADSKTLWECAGESVAATSLDELVDCHAAHHRDGQNRYLHTDVTLRTSNGIHAFRIHNEPASEQLVTYLNRFAWKRSLGNAAPTDNRPDPKNGSAKPLGESRGSVAQFLAQREAKPDVQQIPIYDDNVPTPRRERRAAFGLLNLLLIIGVGVGSVFLFKELNLEWRDDAAWLNVEHVEPQELRAPYLRAYLADDLHVKHRDEARQMLRDIYESAAKRILTGTPKTDPTGITPITSANSKAKDQVDKDLSGAFADLLRGLAEQPLPLVSISAKEKANKLEGAAEREKEMMKKYSHALLEGAGAELIAFVEATPDSAAMVEIVYDLQKVGTSWRWGVTFTFRKSTDGELIKTVTRIHSTTSAPTPATAATIASDFGVKSGGVKKIVLEKIGE